MDRMMKDLKTTDDHNLISTQGLIGWTTLRVWVENQMDRNTVSFNCAVLTVFSHNTSFTDVLRCFWTAVQLVWDQKEESLLGLQGLGEMESLYLKF